MEWALDYVGSGGDKLTESWDICVIVGGGMLFY